MIKVNLLDSVTERASSVAAVEEKVANPAARFWILGGAVFVLLGMGMLFDYVSASASQMRAREELEKQRLIAAQMAAVNKEQAELEQKLKSINTRIDAIKKLRASQQGPVGLLSELNSRIPTDPDFRLESVEQKGGDLIIEGQSPNEYAVTAFGRNLEFSNGLFQSVSIEAERKEVEIKPEDLVGQTFDVDLSLKPEVFRFKIKCRYGAPPPPPPAPGQPAPAGQPAQVAQK
ncbi:MAG TPA: PilN domain-containing protein [Pyrinomonadaceae bacterium]|nr:PilN domain-containing protein [Pyrinomonadaceae bacterium]